MGDKVIPSSSKYNGDSRVMEQVGMKVVGFELSE